MTELVLQGPGAAATEPMDKDRNRSSAHSLQPAPHSKTGHHREQPAHAPSEHPTLQQPEKHPRSDKDPPARSYLTKWPIFFFLKKKNS